MRWQSVIVLLAALCTACHALHPDVLVWLCTLLSCCDKSDARKAACDVCDRQQVTYPSLDSCRGFATAGCMLVPQHSVEHVTQCKTASAMFL